MVLLFCIGIKSMYIEIHDQSNHVTYTFIPHHFVLMSIALFMYINFTIYTLDLNFFSCSP